MEVVIDQPHQIDTLRYRVESQKTVPHETARISVVAVALVPAQDTDQARLLGQIRGALGAFIDTEWRIAQVERSADTTGYERVTVRAHARVPHAQVFNLGARAREASREGLSLIKPEADYSLPTETVSATRNVSTCLRHRSGGV
jgi:hypothetical protein